MNEMHLDRGEFYNGKSIRKLVTLIDTEYVARIKR